MWENLSRESASNAAITLRPIAPHPIKSTRFI
jgi:hypothetical protein